MDLKRIALEPRPAVAELKEFKRGTNDGLRGESAAIDTGKESWAGADATADSLAAGRPGMKLLEKQSLSESEWAMMGIGGLTEGKQQSIKAGGE